LICGVRNGWKADISRGEETAGEGTAQQVNRSSGMGYHSDRSADQMKLEARRFQEELRCALASSRKVTKPRK